MAASDSRPVPRKNTAYRYYFAIRKSDGTLITSWAGQDSEVSLDGGSFSDCSNEATEIGTSGIGYIDLTSGEMNADAVCYKLTVTNTGALPIVVTFFPEEIGDYRANVEQFGGSAGTFSGGRPEVNTTHAAGTAWGSGAITAASIATDAITSAKIAADAIGASELAADAVTEIQSGLSTLTAAGVRTAVGLGSANLDTQLSAIQSDTDNIQTRIPAALVSGRIDASIGAMAADTLTASALATDAVAEIQSGLSTLTAAGVRSAVGLASANLDTQLDALPTNAELATALGTADDAVLSAVAALNNVSSAQVQAAAAAALTAYDPPTSAEMDARTLVAASYATAAGVTAVETDTQDIQARLPAALIGGRIDATVDATGMEAGAIDAILDDTIGDGTLTLRQALRVLVAGMAGKLSGAATATITIRNVADSADVILATVDADGNRSAVTVTP